MLRFSKVMTTLYQILTYLNHNPSVPISNNLRPVEREELENIFTGSDEQGGVGEQ